MAKKRPKPRRRLWVCDPEDGTRTLGDQPLKGWTDLIKTGEVGGFIVLPAEMTRAEALAFVRQIPNYIKRDFPK